MLSIKVSLFIQFIQSWKWKEVVYLVCLGMKTSVSSDLSLLIENSPQKLHSALQNLVFLFPGESLNLLSDKVKSNSVVNFLY